MWLWCKFIATKLIDIINFIIRCTSQCTGIKIFIKILFLKEAGNSETRLSQFLGSPSLSDDLKCQKSNKDWVTLAHLNQSTDLDNVFGCNSLIETSTGGEKLLFLALMFFVVWVTCIYHGKKDRWSVFSKKKLVFSLYLKELFVFGSKWNGFWNFPT